MDWRRALRWGALAGLALSVLTACTVSFSGGMIGALASIGLAALLFLVAGATQTGCTEDPDDGPVGPCLSIVSDADVDAGTDANTDAAPDVRVGPCLSQEIDFGPCLSPDQSVDLSIGPCLSPPEPDPAPPEMGPQVDMGTDMPIGPCLEPPPPDMGVDMMPPDAALQPCLSPPPPDPEDGSGKASPVDTNAIFDKVAAGLPADIAARLKRRG